MLLGCLACGYTYDPDKGTPEQAVQYRKTVPMHWRNELDQICGSKCCIGVGFDPRVIEKPSPET